MKTMPRSAHSRALVEGFDDGYGRGRGGRPADLDGRAHVVPGRAEFAGVRGALRGRHGARRRRRRRRVRAAGRFSR